VLTNPLIDFSKGDAKKLMQNNAVIKHKMTHAPGDFSFVKDTNFREMLDDAYKAITIAEAWEDMKKEPGSGGYMFSKDDYIISINKHIKYTGHSGASYAMIMRCMQSIASYGWTNFVSRPGWN
jgi:hypothetical protein